MDVVEFRYLAVAGDREFTGLKKQEGTRNKEEAR